MNAELLYTSAPEGLKRGSRGFCTVVATEGLPVNVSQRLESLSGYRHVFQPGEDRDADNPVCHSHVRFTVGGRLLHVVSRIAAYGVDYSQRTNKIAHHIVVDRPPPGGPVPLLQSGAFLHSWDGVCRTKSQGPSLQGSAIAASICHRWETVTGDAGWGGLLAAAWASSVSKPLWIVFELSQSKELLALIGESIALLPESARWDATFSTYYTNLPPDVECRVRCVLSGSDEARMAAARGTVIHLKKNQAEPPKSSWVEAARTGHYPSPSSAIPTIDSRELHGGVAHSESSALLGTASDTPADDQLEYELMGVPSASPPPTKASARRRIRTHSAELDDLPPPVRRSKRWLVASIAVAFFALLGSSAALFYWQYERNQRIADALELPEEIQEEQTQGKESETNLASPESVATPVETPIPTKPTQPGATTISHPDNNEEKNHAPNAKSNEPIPKPLPIATLDYQAFKLPWYQDICITSKTKIRLRFSDNPEPNSLQITWAISVIGPSPQQTSSPIKANTITIGTEYEHKLVEVSFETNPKLDDFPKLNANVIKPFEITLKRDSLLEYRNGSDIDAFIQFTKVNTKQNVYFIGKGGKISIPKSESEDAIKLLSDLRPNVDRTVIDDLTCLVAPISQVNTSIDKARLRIDETYDSIMEQLKKVNPKNVIFKRYDSSEVEIESHVIQIKDFFAQIESLRNDSSDANTNKLKRELGENSITSRRVMQKADELIKLWNERLDDSANAVLDMTEQIKDLRKINDDYIDGLHDRLEDASPMFVDIFFEQLTTNVKGNRLPPANPGEKCKYPFLLLISGTQSHSKRDQVQIQSETTEH